MILKKILGRLQKDLPAREAYRQIVLQARQPEFYASLGAPDTTGGRFDMITLHAFLLFDRLRGEKDEKTAQFAQDVFDEMFMDMDGNLREMGVSDVAVGKKVRKLAESFYGRLNAYREALERDDAGGLKDAFNRNIFGGEASPRALEALHDYVMSARKTLAETKTADLRKGRVVFPPAPDMEKGS